jgi:hypothetical protein
MTRGGRMSLSLTAGKNPISLVKIVFTMGKILALSMA